METSEAIAMMRDPNVCTAHRVLIFMQQREIGNALSTDQICSNLEPMWDRKFRGPVFTALNVLFKSGHLTRDGEKWAPTSTIRQVTIKPRRRPVMKQTNAAAPPKAVVKDKVQSPSEICDMVVNLILELKARAERPLEKCSQLELIEELQRRAKA